MGNQFKMVYIKNFIKVLPAETLAIFSAGFPAAFPNTVRNTKNNTRNVRQSFIFLLDLLLLKNLSLETHQLCRFPLFIYTGRTQHGVIHNN